MAWNPDADLSGLLPLTVPGTQSAFPFSSVPQSGYFSMTEIITFVSTYCVLIPAHWFAWHAFCVSQNTESSLDTASLQQLVRGGALEAPEPILPTTG